MEDRINIDIRGMTYSEAAAAIRKRLGELGWMDSLTWGDSLAPAAVHRAKNSVLQAKDIEDAPVLQFIGVLNRPATIFPGFDNSVQNAMPAGVNEKLGRAKMKSLIKRGLVTGCACGCRGDYEMVQS